MKLLLYSTILLLSMNTHAAHEQDPEQDVRLLALLNKLPPELYARIGNFLDHPANLGARGQLTGHIENINVLAFNSDGTLLVSGAQDCTIRLWNVLTGRQHAVVKTPDTPTALALNHNNSVIACGLENGAILIWKLGSNEIYTLKRQNGRITALAFCPSIENPVSCSDDNSVCIWDDINKCETLSNEEQVSMNAVSFTPEGQYLIAKSHVGDIYRWPINSIGDVEKISHPLAEPSPLARIYSDDQQVIIASSDIVGQNLFIQHS